jgi:CHASE2 domain-containing sensor protein
MTDVSAKIVDLITQLQGVVKDNAADAVNLGLESIKIDGIGLMVLFVVLFVIGIIAFITSIKTNNVDLKIVSFVVGISSLCISVAGFLYPWNWVQIFNPKLYLAHEVMSKFFS